MNNLNPAVGQPIRSIQTCLRTISYTYKDIPPIIPDGIYGKQTMDCVIAFQRKYGLPPNGEVDYQTWDKIIAVYNDAAILQSEPRSIQIFPKEKTKFLPQDDSSHLFPIQAVLSLVSDAFPQVGAIDISGIHDEKSVAIVENLQELFGMEKNGIIEKNFWNQVSLLYEAHISRNRF